VKLSVTDLFVVGLGFDISGAIFLARGLLVSPEIIAKLSSTYLDMNSGDAVDRCRNRIDAAFGVGCLVVGFVLQASGYALVLHGSSAGTGGSRVFTALFLGVLGVGAAFGSWAVLHKWLLKRPLVRVAKTSQEGEGEPINWVRRLVVLGLQAGWPRPPEESDGNYIKRVFGEDAPPTAQ
jgi:hypothetical protein